MTVKITMYVFAFSLVLSGCLSVPSNPISSFNGDNVTPTSTLLDLQERYPKWFKDSLYSRPSFWYLSELSGKYPPDGFAMTASQSGTLLTEQSPIIVGIKGYFIGNGFSINQNDTRKYMVEVNQYRYRLVFSRDSLQCDVSWRDETPGKVFVGCISITQDHLDLYNGLALALEEVPYWDVRKYDGLFTLGTLSYGSGANNEWLAKKIGNHWEVLFNGQDYIPCLLLQTNGVLESFFQEDCGLEEGGWMKYKDFLESRK